MSNPQPFQRSRPGSARRSRDRDRVTPQGEAVGQVLRRAFGTRSGQQPVLRGDIAQCLARLDAID